MNVRELRAMLEDYGDHLEVVALDDEGEAHTISNVGSATYDGMTACGIEFD